ncbi:MAG: arylformamidase [Flavobacterium sp.]|jgi:arylformamidase
MKSYLLSLLCLTLLITSCASKKFKNVSYLEKSETSKLKSEPTLNIFQPRNKKYKNNNVLVFVHGGNWNSGDKKTYNFFGRNFAKKGITTVIVGYTLSPEVNYDGMTKQVAKAINWTKNNIQNYNGNANEIFLTGHSAGGHLIALATVNPKYNVQNNTVKGIILNDAAGLDMYNYLKQIPPTTESDYLATWTNKPEEWKKASPIYFLDKNSPKFMIYLGRKTYQSIKEGNASFLKELELFQGQIEPIFLNKKHVPMMTQYVFPWSDRYDEIIDFMNKN